MSQQDLADAMGYKSRSTIAKIESGENDVSQKKLQKFASVLDTTVAALISGSTYTETNPVELTDFDSLNSHKNIVIILAGGKTSQNRQNIPSQFISVYGKPIIVYCMEAYQMHPSINDIYIVCSKSWESIVTAYAKEYGITKLKGIIFPGNSGVSSLKNAISFIQAGYSSTDNIIVQEATRPMITSETISTLLQECYEKGSATTCHSMKDYVQFNLSNNGPQYIDRSTVIALQSPEVHRLSLLQDVFEKAEKRHHSLTESCCTMLLYNMGYQINFIENPINNIKINREEDIAAFKTLIKE